MMFDLGYKADDIAEVSNRSAASVRDHLRTTGRCYKRRYKNADVCPALVVCLRLIGMTMSEIAKEVGFKSDTSVWRVLTKAGLAGNFQGKYDKAIIREYENGCRNASEIARRVGTGQSYVSRRCKVLGLTMPTRDEFNESVHAKAVEIRGEHKPTSDERISYFGAEFDRSVSLPAAIERFGMKCSMCGKETTKSDKRWGTLGPDYPTLDHITPLSKGGGHVWENVQILCGYCNCVVKKDRTEAA